MVLGICGGSGSGKTTLVKELAAYFKELKPAVFSLDNYYKPIEEQAIDKKGKKNFDLPSALDEQQLSRDFLSLHQGSLITVKEYQFNVKDAEEKKVIVEPSAFMIIEGLFLFNYDVIVNHLDYIVFIDLSLEVQLERRINRDVKQRGYAMEDVMYQWDNHVVPCYNQYVLPHKHKADFIYHSDERSAEEFKRLIQVLSSKLKNG